MVKTPPALPVHLGLLPASSASELSVVVAWVVSNSFLFWPTGIIHGHYLPLGLLLTVSKL